MAVQITKKGLLEQIEEIKALDEKIQQARGDEKVLKAQAHEALLTDDRELFPTEEEHLTYNEVLDHMETLRQTLDNMSAWVSQQVDEHVATIRSGSKETVEALKTAREDMANKAQAIRTILETMGDEKDLPEVPKGKRGGNTSGSTGSRTVKTSGARYYRTEALGDGRNEQIDQPDSQNSLSSLAYYFSKHVEQSDGTHEKMSTADFIEWARQTHETDVKQATPWEIPLNDKVSVGMRVVSSIISSDGEETAET